MAGKGTAPASLVPPDGVRNVEQALARAQRLVESKPAGRAGLAWYIEAMNVGDLPLLALLLRRPVPAAARAREDPEARRQLALDRWLREEGLSAEDPRAVAERMDELGPEELERALCLHEQKLGLRPGAAEPGG